MELLWLIANVELVGIVLAAVIVGLGLIVTAAVQVASKLPWWGFFPVWFGESVAIVGGFPDLTDLMVWPAAWLVVHGFTLL